MQPAEQYIAALGGAENIAAVAGRITRVRVDVHSAIPVQVEQLRQIGAVGVVVQRDAVQLIIGADADDLAAEMKQILGISQAE
ncbi:MAG: PTS transporter subunit EIIB [Trueperella sp.]|nr:PTS transporter subunit EIIB [Trueperella sp.]